MGALEGQQVREVAVNKVPFFVRQRGNKQRRMAESGTTISFGRASVLQLTF